MAGALPTTAAAAAQTSASKADETRTVVGTSDFEWLLEQSGLTAFRGELERLGCTDLDHLTRLTDGGLRDEIGMSEDQIALLRESLNGYVL